MKPEKAISVANDVDPPRDTTLPLILSSIALLIQAIVTITFCWGLARDLMQ
ncbi:MAG TPA: hypothetical protein VG841_04250 [Caulobacterales bacterium]|nr:hypothetical protein [Caulobacterales bacterium]